MPEHDNRNLDSGAEFDLLLRSSLETYADPGSDSGLAERVLARVAAEGESGRTSRTIQTRRMIRWAIALPVAACLIVAIILLASKPLHNSADSTNQARVAPPESTNAGSNGSTASLPAVPARHGVVSHLQRHFSHAAFTMSATRLPKLDVFPTPKPLTPAEKALVAYVGRAPQAERESLVEDEQRMNAPLTIEALEIKPLEPTEPQGN